MKKKGIFPNDSCYKKVEAKIDELSQIFAPKPKPKPKPKKKADTLTVAELEEFNETDRMRISYASKPYLTPAYKDMDLTTKLGQTNRPWASEYKGNMQSSFKAPSLKSVPVKELNKKVTLSNGSGSVDLNVDFKFSKEKLIYYQTLKQSLRPLFYKHSVSNLDLFDLEADDLGVAFKELASMLPIFRHILKLGVVELNHDNLVKLLKEFGSNLKGEKEILENVNFPYNFFP